LKQAEDKVAESSYDIDGARAAGFTDEQIATHLAQKIGYDLDGALGAGLGYDEILPHLLRETAPKPNANLIPPPAPWYMDRDLQMFAAVIVLFPWFVFFNLRLMRYVIEGFRPERE
jgi:hypothetical protein